MKRLAAVLAAALLAAGCGIDIDDTADVVGATASVEAVGCQPTASGTAVAIGPDRFLTAAHTVTGARELTVTTSRGELPAVTLVLDTDIDVAVLGVDGYDGPYLELGGERVEAAAAMLLVDDGPVIEPTELRRVVWTNTPDVFGDGRFERLSIEIDAEIDFGDSGAAVVDRTGAVVGIMVSDVRDAAIAFAVHPFEIRPRLEAAVGLTEHVAGRCRR